MASSKAETLGFIISRLGAGGENFGETMDRIGLDHEDEEVRRLFMGLAKAAVFQSDGDIRVAAHGAVVMGVCLGYLLANEEALELAGSVSL